MAAIYKYDIKVGVNNLRLPMGAKFLSVGEQDDELKVWVLLDPKAPEEPRKLVVVPTGGPANRVSPFWQFIGTVLVVDGQFVWHVFEAPADLPNFASTPD